MGKTTESRCSPIFDFREDVPAPGHILHSTDGETSWELRDAYRHRRRDGIMSMVLVWVTACKSCGKDFPCTTGLSTISGEPKKTCDECRTGERKKTLYKRAGLDRAEKRKNTGRRRKTPQRSVAELNSDRESFNPEGEPVREADESMADYTKRLKQWSKERKG